MTRVVRVRMRERPLRTPLEHAVVRADGWYRRMAAPVFRLPAGSRLRTALLKIMVERAFAALNREDLELVQVLYHPDAVLRFAGDIGIDFEERYDGRDVSFEAYRSWLREWSTVRRHAVGFVDRGDVLVVLAREVIRGESSGLEVDRELGQVFRLRDGAVAEQTEHRSWEEALAQ